MRTTVVRSLVLVSHPSLFRDSLDCIGCSIANKHEDRFVRLRDEAIKVPTSGVHLYGDLSHEVLRTKYFIAEPSQVCRLVVIDRHE